MTDIKTGAAGVAIAIAFGLLAGEAREPRWQKSRDLCRQLRAEGWTPSPEGPGDPATGELSHGNIFICRVRLRLPPRAGTTTPAHIDVFLEQGGGNNLTISAEVWSAADQTATLTAVARTLTRAARELQLDVPPGMMDAVAKGERWSDEAGALSFDIWTTTRAAELVSQPDAKPGDIPLVQFKVIVEPTP